MECIMHEMSITQGIIDICESHAGGRRVLAVDVEIGELSSVVPEAIEFCFEACSQGTLIEGARINIVRIPGIGQCQDCGRETPLTSLFGACQLCGGFRVTVISGEEMKVREIEVDD
jgi:hydrogenase nickel incorporation protein HypA/HybF